MIKAAVKTDADTADRNASGQIVAVPAGTGGKIEIRVRSGGAPLQQRVHGVIVIEAVLGALSPLSKYHGRGGVLLKKLCHSFRN
jgi:hypothetical protein